jgi:hypothetical protein
LFFIIILISSVLAYRSMRDYEEFPDTLSLNSLFYIGAPQNLKDALKRLHDVNLSEKHFFSLEKLIKGAEKAWVIFGNRDLQEHFPELNLIEIEDYINENSLLQGSESEKSVGVNQTLSWLIEPKNNPKKVLHVTNELKGLKAAEDQKIFIQAVLMPVEKPGEESFQSTLRIMVADPDPIKKVELAKKINQVLSSATGLNKREDDFPESRKFDSFKQRTLIPKEVAEFYLTADEVLALLA